MIFTRKRSGNGVLAIAVGGLVAGTLDLTQAIILFGKNIPLVIAAGVLGPQAFHGGAGRIFWVCCCNSSLSARRQPSIAQSAAS
jgi:hypothetical protein